MAVLQQPVVGGNVFAELIGDDLAPAGTYVAMVIDIRDEFGVTRPKFQSQEMETVDLTTFLFGFRDAQGYEHRVASRRMKISGNEKSSLFAFLKSLLGRAPQYGWDYLALKGAQCLLTVEHVTKRDGTGVFAAIAALSPVPAGFAGGAGQTVGPSGGQPFGGAPAFAGPATAGTQGGPVPQATPAGGARVPGSGAPAHSTGSGQAGPAAPPYPVRPVAPVAGRPVSAGPAFAGAMAGRPAAVAAGNEPLPF